MPLREAARIAAPFICSPFVYFITNVRKVLVSILEATAIFLLILHLVLFILAIR
jgi:hypothetical protein